MVGIVLVSHSSNLAESVAEYTKIMAPDAKVATAGGTEDGSFGTSFEKIYAAIEQVASEEGVIILVDMGSAVMTTEMVLEAYGAGNVAMADCPFVEGAVVATLHAAGGMSRENILNSLAEVGSSPKF